MSLVIGIDTCTRWSSIGCTLDGEPIGEVNLKIGTHQSAQLPHLLQTLLHSLGKQLTDIDLLAVTTGPGYFTGVRIGLAYAAALAEALEVKIVPVSTLESFVVDLPPGETLYLPVLWARREHVYFAAYKRMAECLSVISPPVFCHIQTLNDYLDGAPLPVVWLGESPERCGLSSERIQTFWNRSAPRGANVAILGEMNRDQALAPACLQADYLRDPDIGRV
jgi:tRNA threonylcarbamoyladenosine biosynthesis protein TsaB